MTREGQANLEDQTFTLFWLTGETQIVAGRSISEAMTHAGYGSGSVKALDFYSTGDCRGSYEWNAIERTWKPHAGGEGRS